eukprot:gene52872-17715_t
MFLFGIFCGMLGRFEIGSMDLYTGIADIDPHALLYIFLPVLIFESAFSLDVHVFKKVVWHCVLLAGPGLCLSSFLLGSLAKLAFGYGWNWSEALLFGCILSAELGVDKQIGSLIEGESLLNDGSAIVFYTILAEAARNGGAVAAPAQLLLTFCRISFGGPVVGAVAGACTTAFLNTALLGVSGVLALVILGLYLSHHRFCISPEVEHLMHEFWEIVVYLANTVIFSLAGVVIVKKAIGTHIEGRDLGILVLVYIACLFVRTAVVGVALPILDALHLPYRLDWRNALLASWGGLRGAVGLALALSIGGDNEISFSRVGGRIIFHCSGIVLLTLMVNGVFTPAVVRALGLSKVSFNRKRLMATAFQKLVYEQENTCASLVTH